MIYLYAAAVRIAALVGNEKARQLLKGQKEVWLQLATKLQPNEQRIWIHCASVGEFEQGRPLIEELREKYPQYKITVTFFSPSGYELRKNYPDADYIFYLPFDTKKNACRFVALLQPVRIFFIKYEFWRNYLREIKRLNIPFYLVSANFRQNQAFFQWYGGWYCRLLKTFTWFFVQNERSQTLLAKIGFLNATVTGDTRFDRVCKIVAQAKTLPLVEQFVQDSRCIVAGSTWAPDINILLRYIGEGKHPLKWIIAPHELHEEQINHMIETVNSIGKGQAIRYSQLKGVQPCKYQVLVIDNIGMLSSLYRYGQIAYIGGGFGKGIHNTLEAAAYHIPVFFGTAYKKFQEAIDLVNLGGAFPVNNFEEFARHLDELLDHPEKLSQAGQTAGDFVLSGKGATAQVLQLAMK
ncbi:MAG: 3-deoxy-D-manno-octulosonic acid transferase [Bacteroidales bacterium]|nr:3-deoxy-D-manno-octulosonic acid transferase [Bacteroidales bacterium]